MNKSVFPAQQKNSLVETLKYFLLQREAMSLKELAGALNMDIQSAWIHLEYWVARDEIECIAPIDMMRDRELWSTRPDFVFYRWKRESDGDWLWERAIS